MADRSLGSFASRLVALGLTGALSLLIIAPWAVRLWSAHHDLIVHSYAWQPVTFPVELATAGDDRIVVALGCVGLLLAVIRRPSLAALFVTWFAFVFVLANAPTFHLPVFLFLDDGSVAIALFVPAAVLVGLGLESAVAALSPSHRRREARVAAAGVVLALGLTQAPALTTVANPCCVLVRPGDLAAMRWIRQNTPTDARFIINGYQWAYTNWAGTDAGYWLPVLANRRTNLPPLFYAVGPSSNVNRIDDLARSVQRDAANPGALAALARQIGASYVFIGSRGGDLDPYVLAKSRYFRVVYGGGVGSGGGEPGGSDGDEPTAGVSGGGAWVFELVGPAPGDTSSTDTGITPARSSPPRDWKAAGLKSRTSG